MSTTITFSDGTTATLKDAEEMTNRQVKLLQRSMRTAATAAAKMQEAGYVEGQPETWAPALSALSDDELDSIDLYQRSAVVLRLESWTREGDIPADADAVDDLPRLVFEKLTTAAADIKLSEDFGVDPDPKAHTAA